MSEENLTPASETTQRDPAEKKKGSLVDSVFGIGLEWATFGVKTGQTALETAARTLEGAAKALEQVSAELGKKG